MDNVKISSKRDDVVRIDLRADGSDFRQDILFLSDIHIDSPWCDRKLLKRHLDEAREAGAIVLIAGDLFDAMQGPNDPRRSKRDLKLMLSGDNYFDLVLDDAVEFFRPYGDILAMVGYGNHEYSVLRHNSTDLIQRFVGALRRDGSPVVAGGYGGYIRVSVFTNMPTPSATTWIYYNHGAGGDAPVTRGMIATNRQAAWITNCETVWNGHNHQTYTTAIPTRGPTNKDTINQGMLHFIRTPGYKNETEQMAHGFAASRNAAPTPRGCVWGHYRYYSKQLKIKYTEDVE